MNLGAFAIAIARHRTIALYMAIAAAALIFAIFQTDALEYLAISAVLAILFYPFVEYGLHRFLLHMPILCRTRLTASIWRRLHYDHHMNPHDLTVLLAHPAASVPFLAFFSLLSCLAFGIAMFPAMMFWSVLAFIYYEIMHAAAHMAPRIHGRWLVRHCRSHLRHHYVDETAHFGIGSTLLDRLFPLTARSADKIGRSPTVRTLGYDGEMAKRYPWVAAGYASKQSRSR
ncbi:MAG: sterol desaturase family protein [Proteobacteria bacterium]|nr:sterol desaturase family protein [Pseudomonadota bacterium]